MTLDKILTAEYKTLGAFLVFILGPLYVPKISAFGIHQGDRGVSQCEGVQPTSPILSITRTTISQGLSTLKRLVYCGAGLYGQNIGRYGLHLAVKLYGSGVRRGVAKLKAHRSAAI